MSWSGFLGGQEAAVPATSLPLGSDTVALARKAMKSLRRATVMIDQPAASSPPAPPTPEVEPLSLDDLPPFDIPAPMIAPPASFLEPPPPAAAAEEEVHDPVKKKRTKKKTTRMAKRTFSAMIMELFKSAAPQSPECAPRMELMAQLALVHIKAKHNAAYAQVIASAYHHLLMGHQTTRNGGGSGEQVQDEEIQRIENCLDGLSGQCAPWWARTNAKLETPPSDDTAWLRWGRLAQSGRVRLFTRLHPSPPVELTHYVTRDTLATGTHPTLVEACLVNSDDETACLLMAIPQRDYVETLVGSLRHLKALPPSQVGVPPQPPQVNAGAPLANGEKKRKRTPVVAKEQEVIIEEELETEHVAKKARTRELPWLVPIPGKKDVLLAITPGLVALVKAVRRWYHGNYDALAIQLSEGHIRPFFRRRDVEVHIASITNQNQVDDKVSLLRYLFHDKGELPTFFVVFFVVGFLETTDVQSTYEAIAKYGPGQVAMLFEQRRGSTTDIHADDAMDQDEPDSFDAFVETTDTKKKATRRPARPEHPQLRSPPQKSSMDSDKYMVQPADTTLFDVARVASYIKPSIEKEDLPYIKAFLQKHAESLFRMDVEVGEEKMMQIFFEWVAETRTHMEHESEPERAAAATTTEYINHVLGLTYVLNDCMASGSAKFTRHPMAFQVFGMGHDAYK